jgi:protein-S-isoprenylcysteine O-methyltransferase Ste14
VKFLVTLLVLLLSVALLASISAARPTLPELKVIPLRVLQRSISPKFYKSLTISPVDAHIVVCGTLVGTHLSGLRIVKSEVAGRWDDLALKRAREVEIAGNYTIDSPNYGHPVLLHLLIYNIADGTMALSFVHLDVPGGDQDYYFGCARLAVLKADGKWTDIKGPPGLEGQGWAVRSPGFRNDIKASLKLENIPGPRR